MRASQVKAPTDKAPKRPKKGPLRCKPNGNPMGCISPTETRKNGPMSGHTRKGGKRTPALFPRFPRGIDGLARHFCAHEEYSPPSRRIAWGVQFWDHVP